MLSTWCRERTCSIILAMEHTSPQTNGEHQGTPRKEPSSHNSIWLLVLAAAIASVVWASIGFFGPFILQSRYCELGTDQPNRGQLGDQFGMVNALFTGLALAGVVVSVVVQRREAKIAKWRFDKERDDHSADVKQTLYTARLATLVEHYRLFREHQHYQRARSLAWACTQKALRGGPFRDYLASSHSLVHLKKDKVAHGYLCRVDPKRGAAESKEVLTWTEASHYLDDLISFFSVFSLHVKAIEDLNLTGADLQTFRRVVRQMNIYWDWWGPVVQYVEHLRQETNKSRGEPERRISAPDHSAEFQRIDEYMFHAGFSTRMPEQPKDVKTSDAKDQPNAEKKAQAEATKEKERADQLLDLLKEIKRRGMSWQECNEAGIVDESARSGNGGNGPATHERAAGDPADAAHMAQPAAKATPSQSVQQQGSHGDGSAATESPQPEGKGEAASDEFTWVSIGVWPERRKPQAGGTAGPSTAGGSPDA